MSSRGGWAAGPTLGAIAALVVAPAGATGLAEAWTRSLGGARAWYEYKAAAVSPRGEIWVGFGARDLAAGTAAARLWKLGPDGATLGEYALEPPASGSKRAEHAEIKAIVPLPDGGINVLAAFAGDRPWLVRLDADGKQVAAAQVIGRGRDVQVARLIQTADRNYMLLGHDGLDALLVKLDPAGKVLWEKRDDRGKMDFYLDGLAGPDGSLTVVGNSGTYDWNFQGESVVWVALLDKDGNRQAERLFPGRDGRLARGRDGSYALVYDRASGESKQIELRRLGARLEDLGPPVEVTGAAQIDGRFAVWPAPTGTGFIVTGARESKVYLGRADVDAAAVQPLVEEPLPAGVSLDALSTRDGLLLASSIVRKFPDQPAEQVLRVVRFVNR